MNPVKKFDLIVLGGGSAGYAAARTAHEKNARVAVVDGAQDLGGLCILRGCMPSKTLIYSAEMLHAAGQGDVFGFETASPKANLAMMQERKQKVIGEFADYRQEQLADGRFSLFRTKGILQSVHEVKLETGEILEGDKILISTGSKVSIPPIPGLSDVAFKTSDDVLDLDYVPSECVVLGGGVVACELAQFLARVGSRVTILQRSNRLLKELPPEASSALRAQLTEEGVEVLTGVNLQEFKPDKAGGIKVFFEHGGKACHRDTNFLFLGLGRCPNVNQHSFGTLGVKLKPSGHIQTNHFQQTSVPSIYAAGDCAGPHEIVHIAVKQGETAALHALGHAVSPIGYDHLLSVVFTDPQIAKVGLSPEELKSRGIQFLSASYPFDDHGKSILMEAKRGYVAVHAEKSSGIILGAECAGKDAGELIHSLSVAVSLQATVHQLLKADWYHPTLSEIWTYPLEDIAEEIPI
ncbi:MAG: FAD-dependent oxidoreductase [Opitutales bacterium]|nr:FAD-dependent oxidoreductase [Opitutales bacterium]